MPENLARTTHRPAGWYTDPDRPSGSRWWTGTEWVGHPIIEKPFSAASTTNDPAQASQQLPDEGPSNHSFLAMVIALSPLYVLIIWSLITFVPSAGIVHLLVTVLSPPVGVALIVILLAFVDRHLLLKSGHPSAANGFWILLTPIGYLSARATNTKRHTGHGWKPFWTHVIIVLLIIATALVISVVYLVTSLSGGYQL